VNGFVAIVVDRSAIQLASRSEPRHCHPNHPHKTLIKKKRNKRFGFCVTTTNQLPSAFFARSQHMSNFDPSQLDREEIRDTDGNVIYVTYSGSVTESPKQPSVVWRVIVAIVSLFGIIR
jgi:hypothetical protein